MTRRIVKFPKDYTGELVTDNSPYGLKYSNGPDTMERMACPYGSPGEMLWVKETFVKTIDGPVYKADHTEKDGTLVAPDGKTFILSVKWTPSIFMPLEAHRINLKIIRIRVERLHDISMKPLDIVKEGIEQGSSMSLFQAFAGVWATINGYESWVSNPWVWVIEFVRIG